MAHHNGTERGRDRSKALRRGASLGLLRNRRRLL